MDYWLGFIAYELTLFAAIGFLVGGFDDVIIDCIWVARTLWRRLTVYRVTQRVTITTLNPPVMPGRIIVFIAAWDEAGAAPHLYTAGENGPDQSAVMLARDGRAWWD